jgi:hypothetical protein
MPPARFEPAIPTKERPQTHAWDRAATEISWYLSTVFYKTQLDIAHPRKYVSIFWLWSVHVNPLPVQFKAVLRGQKGCVFFSGHLSWRITKSKTLGHKMGKAVHSIRCTCDLNGTHRDVISCHNSHYHFPESVLRDAKRHSARCYTKLPSVGVHTFQFNVLQLILGFLLAISIERGANIFLRLTDKFHI